MGLSAQRCSEIVRVESARFRDALSDAEPQAQVPTCPEWNVDDLLDHLYRVQTLWRHVVDAGVVTTQEVRELPAPAEPDTRGDLFSLGEAASAALVAALDSRAPTDPAWSWSGDHTVGFTMRRQAHEATIHRIDAEVAGGVAATPVDVEVAQDGVDEVLRVHAGSSRAAAGEVSGARRVRVVATDTGATWMVSIVPPATADGGPRLVVDDVDSPDGRGSPSGLFTATSEDLYRWFWGRPTLTAPRRGGDLVTVAEFERVVRARMA